MRGTFSPLRRRVRLARPPLTAPLFARLLRPVTDETYAPYPALTAAGRGENTPANVAFTEWLTHLRDGVALTEENGDRLHDLWLATGLSSRTWETLGRDAQAAMGDIWRKKHFDWSGLGGAGLSECWNRVCSEDIAEGAAAFDVRLLLPTRLDVEINGFNGGLLAGVPDAYRFYLSLYGVKWPEGYQLEVGDSGPDFLEVDFDTPWSPMHDRVFATLSERFGVTVEHWYAERGCDFCGYDTYSHGELTDRLSSSLEWGEEDEDGFACVTGPDWIVNNVGHYGG
ncbi:DUF1281 domain-containing protein [Pantoea ananatis]|uniref:DUF1281 domain-containing protein n=1 Tax=Pantoea ananas TaxID=553 RepID=UPI003FA49D64